MASRLVTRLELAKRLQCNPQTIVKWVEEGLPVERRGKGGRASKYDMAKARAWVQAREDAARQQGPDFAVSRARKELAQAIEAEQRVAMRAGKLIAIEDVDRIWSAQVAAVRSRLLSLPTALSDRLHRAAALDGVVGVERMLLDAVHGALRELSSGARATTPVRKTRRKAGKKR